MCSGSVSGFTLGKWGEEKKKKAAAECLICLLGKSAFPESRGQCSHLEVGLCILPIDRITCYLRYLTTLAVANWS